MLALAVAGWDLTAPTLESAVRTDDTHLTVTLSENCSNLVKANNGGFTVTETGTATTYAVTATAQGSDARHVVLTVANLGISAKEGVTVTYTAGVNGTIQDIAGNVLTSDATGVVVAGWDTTAATITSGTLAANNGYIDLVFNEGVYTNNSGSGALTVGDLALTFTQNSGTATNVAISSIKKNNSTVATSAAALTGGETTIRIFLIVTGIPNGAETIEIKPDDGSAIYDKAGNEVSALQTTGLKNLKDKFAPTISGAAFTDNTHLTVTMSENCKNIAKTGTGGFTVYKTGTTTAYTVSAIAQGADASQVVLTVANMGTAGRVGVTVKYTKGTTGTIQDLAGNPLATNSTGVAIAAWDISGPTITPGTLAANNAYIDLNFNEGVYGAATGTTAIITSKLVLSFVQNGGIATNVVISAVKKNNGTIASTASALIGGETTIRVFLTITGDPNGMETIEIKPVSGTAIYDKAGNAAAVTETTGSKFLND